MPEVAKIARRLINEGFLLRGELYTVDGVARAVNELLGGVNNDI